MTKHRSYKSRKTLQINSVLAWSLKVTGRILLTLIFADLMVYY